MREKKANPGTVLRRPARKVPRHVSITKTRGVCGGAACIKNLRMPVWVLYQARLAGVSDKELLERYPFLTQAELRDAWRYAEDHPREIARKMRENDW